jgi:Ca2+-transporting ATPase
VLLGLAQGGLLMVAAVGLYALSLHWGLHEDVARAMTIVATVTGNLCLVRVDAFHDLALSHIRRPVQQSYWVISGVAVAVVALALFIPQLRELFLFGLPTPLQLAIAIGAGLTAAALADLLKLVPAVRRIAGAPKIGASVHMTDGD